MIDVARLFDAYNRQARLYPALIALLPPLVLAIGLFPDLTTADKGAMFVALAASTGALFLVADVGRSLGKQIEATLLSQWGGWPSTLWLRHGNAFLAEGTVLRYHARLAARLPDLAFPTPQAQQNDPHAADAVYRSAIEWLKEQCRGNQLVEKENATYGFRRNLLGLKPIGILISVATIAIAVLLVLADQNRSLSNLPAGFADQLSLIFVCSFSTVALIVWTIFITPAWVRQAADAYARALLSCCEQI